MKTNALLSQAEFSGGVTPHVDVGDIVQTSENFHPHYQVIAVAADRAWVRDIQHGTDHIVPIGRCRRIEGCGA